VPSRPRHPQHRPILQVRPSREPRSRRLALLALAIGALLTTWAGVSASGGPGGRDDTHTASAAPSPLALPATRAPGPPPEPTPPAPRATPAPTTAPTASPVPSAEPQSSPVAYADDHCTVRDVLTPYRDPAYHRLTVLDHTHMVPETYRPPELVAVSKAGFTGYGSNVLVRPELIPDLAALRKAALRAGHTLQVRSAYRSYATQAATFRHWVNLLGRERALQRAARPGHSEHQLGTAIDVSSPSGAGVADWAKTPAGAWMAKHAWAFGFVMSYPAGKQAITCFGYEPWHYRWIGRELAAEWYASGLTLRELLVSRG
jgi:zinc D-Ala-D-Ala carboxypeptidase